jgi:hypothetical protein
VGVGVSRYEYPRSEMSDDRIVKLNIGGVSCLFTMASVYGSLINPKYLVTSEDLQITVQCVCSSYRLAEKAMQSVAML